jgi:glycolate oxidase FAD binding subunit
LPSVSEQTRILEHEPGDLTCIVEAGVTISSLQAALGGHGQRLSLDPPGDPTLEQCLLHDLSGPLRHRFGTMRDLVIGVTVTLLDGTRASSGGKVVKNVAGYDLGKLFCGSRGRLGSVERVALRLHPRPVAQRTVAVDADRWPSLHHSGLVPSAVDVVGGRMLVLFEGGEGAVHAQATELGGEDVEPWAEVRALQADLHRRVRWDGGPAPLVRPGPRVAYVEGEPAETWSPLAERVVEALRKASCSPS